MDLHLFTTDRSALDLIGRLPGGDRVVCLVVPENRAGGDKVARLGAAAGALPVRPAPSVKGECRAAAFPSAAGRDTVVCLRRDLEFHAKSPSYFVI